MKLGKAPALENSLRLFNDIKRRGLQIILVSIRREHLRSATIDNLVNVGYYGWTNLILRLLLSHSPVYNGSEYSKMSYLFHHWLIWFFFFLLLINREPKDELKGVQQYKSDVRKQLNENGYRIWGVVGDQYSSIQGLPTPKRTFKLPNPLYYIPWTNFDVVFYFPCLNTESFKFNQSLKWSIINVSH